MCFLALMALAVKSSGSSGRIPRQVSEAAGAWLIDEDEQGGAGYASSLPARGSEGR